jgi:xanthine dehydrogenase YagR molybdenum-binding subunit
MAEYKWPKQRHVIGQNVRRLDGPLKATGKAKYSYDRNLPDLLHAKILRSAHAHARIVSMDLGPAEAMKGVHATHVIKEPGQEVHYQGDEIAAVAAETEEIAREAIRAIQIKYEVLPHVASEKAGLEAFEGDPRLTEEGEDLEQAFEDAAVVVEGFYGAPVVTHVCLETHGMVSHWVSPEELVVYASTQNVTGIANSLRNTFKDIPNLKVTCETPFMGGGFGSKFGVDVHGVACAKLAHMARRPVKLMLERDEEHICAGNRPSAYAKVKAGVDDTGKLVALEATSYGTGGHSRKADFLLPYIYVADNLRREHRNVQVNAGDARAMRAPRHPQGSLVTEQVMDALADELGMDPVDFRLINLPDNNPRMRMLKPIFTRELILGAEAIGWRKKRRPTSERTPGPIQRGLGCAIGTWAGKAGNSQAPCTIHPDGKVVVECGTQDLGTGTATLVPMVAAEVLGLEVKDIDGRIGNSNYPPSGASGGSTTCGGVSVSTAVSCTKAREKIFESVANTLDVEPDTLIAEGGRIFVKGSPDKGLSWKQSCALLGQQPVAFSGDKNEGKDLASQGVGGAQFAEVTVDTESGEVRLEKLVAVADCGLIMNRILCESQVYGGVVGGINYALFEDRVLDPATGIQLNPDLEWYKLAGHSDLGEIEVHLLDYPERGVIGIGEPPTIPTAAAIANAVRNAIGAYVGTLPVTPDRVLASVEMARKKQEGEG